MTLLAEKEDNESYTFRQMLKQLDTAGFINVMIKETSNHESKGHWEIFPGSQKPRHIKTILAI